MMPPGFTFQDKIEINVVSGGVGAAGRLLHRLLRLPAGILPLRRRPCAPSDLAQDLGFSGLKVRHPINRPGVWDEIAVFQGASYFRAVAHGTIYGLSARGLAIGTGGPGSRKSSRSSPPSGCRSRSRAIPCCG